MGSLSCSDAQVPTWDSGSSAWICADLSLGTPEFDVQTFDANGTWTKIAGATEVLIRCWGGGGCTGSCGPGQPGDPATQGSGGGAGLYEATLPANSVTDTVAVTIGNGGSPRNHGGTSTFGSYISAIGGNGSPSSGGNGGHGTGGYGSPGTNPPETQGGHGGGQWDRGRNAVWGGAGGTSNNPFNGSTEYGGVSTHAGNGGNPGQVGQIPGGGGGMGASGGRGRCVITTAYIPPTGLNALECTDGQVAKWNDGASEWQCADDNAGGGGSGSGSGVGAVDRVAALGLGTAPSGLSEWPVAIKCDVPAHDNDHLQFLQAVNSAGTEVTYVGGSTYRARVVYNISTGAYVSGDNATNCYSKSLQTLCGEGRCFYPTDVSGGGSGGGGSGQAIIDILAAGTTIDPITITATNNKWPDYIACNRSSDDGVQNLVLSNYSNAANDNFAVYFSTDHSKFYRFEADGTYNIRNDVEANCGSPGPDLEDICNDNRCGFFGSGSGGGSGGGSSATSVIDGWPDAITCYNSGNGAKLVLDAAEMPWTNGLYYYTNNNDYTEGQLAFNSDQTYNTNTALAGFDCISKTISQLETDGQAFNFVGGGSGGSGSGGGGGPDYDSGWISVPSTNSSTLLTHNLGTRDFALVTVEGAKDSSGTNPFWVTGVTSSGTGQYGNGVMVVDDNSVRVSSYPTGAM